MEIRRDKLCCAGDEPKTLIFIEIDHIKDKKQSINFPNQRRDSFEFVIRKIPSLGFFDSIFFVEEFGTLGNLTGSSTGFPL